MFAIPFFSGIVIALDAFNLFNFNLVPVISFIFGSIVGTFYILLLYAKYAKIIQSKTGKLTKDINIVLSVLTALAAIFTALKLFI
jgi:hypothetical protein